MTNEEECVFVLDEDAVYFVLDEEDEEFEDEEVFCSHDYYDPVMDDWCTIISDPEQGLIRII